MAIEVLQIGNKIEMNIVGKRTQISDSFESDVYISQFMHWAEHNVAAIAVPTYKGHFVPLHLDDVYEFKFFTKGGIYRCRGKIVKRPKTSDNITVTEVKFISALEKFQRRQYYRMNCIIPMSYAVLTGEQRKLYKEKKRCFSLEQKTSIEKKLENQNIVFQKATVLDISGGGMRYNSEIPQESGDIVLLQPFLPEYIRKRIPFLFGRIISSRKIPNKQPEIFDNRVEYVDISSSEREQIITYIFKEERDKRKREADLK